MTAVREPPGSVGHHGVGAVTSLARPHTSWRAEALGEIFDGQRPTTMSVPLQVCLWLMARAASDETHPAHRIVRHPNT